MTGILQALLSCFGGQATPGPSYVEDVFSTYLYTGNGSTQTIDNGMDLSGSGGMVWIKSRSAATDHALYDTARGATFDLVSNSSAAQTTQATGLTSFNFNGFSIGALAKLNTSSATYASWTFEKKDKFFDVRAVSHTNGTATDVDLSNLGTLGAVIFKDTGSGNWFVWHRSLSGSNKLLLNTTDNQAIFTTFNVSGTTVTISSAATTGTKLIYAFAHDAGGFGALAADNIISCGTYLGSNHRAQEVVQLGYEPQWVLIKNITTSATQWVAVDNMRGMARTGPNSWLAPNSAAIETTTAADRVVASATGFFFDGAQQPINEAGSTFVYIAIRRGPMRVPVSGINVFQLSARTGTGVNATVTGGVSVDDLAIIKNRGVTTIPLWVPRMVGINYLSSNSTAIEVAAGATILQSNPWDVMDGVKVGTTSNIVNASANNYINYLFSRAPYFFDVVCYTGTGANTTQAHNLGVAPDLIIVKARSALGGWNVYSSALTNAQYILLDSTAGRVSGATNRWNSTSPTASVFSLGTSTDVNGSGTTYVAYLFGTIGGVSKSGGYTGTGAAQIIDCGFTTGARFVMIKRTDAIGGWYVWDSARGITAGNDPFLFMDSTAVENTTTDYINAASAGFEITSTAPIAINAAGGSYLFLAIA